MSEEVRFKDPDSGGEKGEKEERFDLIPKYALEQVALVYGCGAKKYAERNWERGYPWHLAIAALHRHLVAFERGESMDSETKCHHLASVCFHALALMTFEKYGLGKDDRSTL